MARKLSRRQFLKYAGLTGASVLGGSALAACRPAPTPVAEKPIKIGGIYSLSGVVAAWGKAGRQGAMMAAKEINEAGGILGRPIELKFEDDTVSGEVGVRKARKLVLEWGADFLMGINASGVGLAVTAVLPELKRIHTIPCAASPRITTEAFNKYIFRAHPNCYQIGAGAAAIAADMPYKRWTVIGPDYSYGYDSWGAFITHLLNRRPDVEVLEVQAWPKFAAGQYESHITQLLNAKPEGVYSPLWGGDFVTFVKQAVKFNFFDQVGVFMTPAGLALDAFYALGEDVPENLYSAAHGYWFEHPPTDRNKQWVEKFMDMWGEYPHIVAHDSYGVVYLYKKAIEKAGTTDTDAVIEAMEGLEFETPAYDRKIRKEDHQAISDVPWGRTAEAEELLPFRRRLTDIKDSPGEEIIEPVEQMLRRRREGGEPPWMKYIHKA